MLFQTFLIYYENNFNNNLWYVLTMELDRINKATFELFSNPDLQLQ